MSATNQASWSQSVRRRPPPAHSPQRLRRRARTPEHPRGRCSAHPPARRLSDIRRSVPRRRRDRCGRILHPWRRSWRLSWPLTDDVWRPSDDVLPMRWACAAFYSWLAVSSLYVPTSESSGSGWRGYLAGGCSRRNDVGNGLSAAASSKVRYRWTDREPRLRPGLSSVSPGPSEWSGPARGREGPPSGHIWLTWDMTLVCDVDHVTCSGVSEICRGKLPKASKSPRQVGISKGRDRRVAISRSFRDVT
jgi:hypothetical protein